MTYLITSQMEIQAYLTKPTGKLPTIPMKDSSPRVFPTKTTSVTKEPSPGTSKSKDNSAGGSSEGGTVPVTMDIPSQNHTTDGTVVDMTLPVKCLCAANAVCGCD